MNDPLEDRIRQALEQSSEQLDAATASRLNQIRQAALDQARQPRKFGWLPLGGGLATAAALVLAMSVALKTPEPTPGPDSDLSDLELVAGEDLELVAELDFYLWLEAELEENG